MAITDRKWPLAQAEGIVKSLVSHLQGACQRIEVAGSIRRQRSECGDIDLVAFPLYQADLFGNPGGPMLLDQLLCNMGVAWTGGEKIHRFQWELADIDLYLCDKDNFALTWLIRTGSAEHNQYLCQLANQRGYSISYSQGLKNRATDEVLIIKTEEELFHLLGLSYVEPHLREAVPVQGYPSLRPVYLMKGAKRWQRKSLRPAVRSPA